MREQRPTDTVNATSERTQLLRKQARDRIELWHYFTESYPETDFSADDDLTDEQTAIWCELEKQLSAWHQAELNGLFSENNIPII